MGNVLAELFQDQANAIREGLGDIGKFPPAEFAERIRDIVALIGTGGDSGEVDDILDEINGEVVGETLYTVTFCSPEGEIYFQTQVYETDDCPDPVKSKDIPTPTKESTSELVYTYSGWSLTVGGMADSSALKNITSDQTVYAAFTSSTRYYTVRFFDGTTLLNTELLTYGESSSYTTTKTGAYFQGWSPEPTNITSNLDCYAEWVYAAFSTDSWATIKANAQAGNAEDYYAVGDAREITLQGGETIILEIVALNSGEALYDSAGNAAGTAGIVVVAKTPLAASNMAFSTTADAGTGNYYTTDGFRGSDVLTWLNDTVLPSLPADLLPNLDATQKVFSYNNYNTGIKTRTDNFKLWVPSVREVYGILDVYGDIVYPAYRPESGVANNNAAASRIRTLANNTAVKWWLRTCTSGNNAAIVTADGAISDAHAKEGRAYVIFGFCL